MLLASLVMEEMKEKVALMVVILTFLVSFVAVLVLFDLHQLLLKMMRNFLIDSVIVFLGVKYWNL